MASAFGRSISHAVPGRRISTPFTEIGRDEGVNRVSNTCSGQVLDFSNTSSGPLSPFRLVSAGAKAPQQC